MSWPIPTDRQQYDIMCQRRLAQPYFREPNDLTMPPSAKHLSEHDSLKLSAGHHIYWIFIDRRNHIVALHT